MPAGIDIAASSNSSVNGNHNSTNGNSKGIYHSTVSVNIPTSADDPNNNLTTPNNNTNLTALTPNSRNAAAARRLTIISPMDKQNSMNYLTSSPITHQRLKSNNTIITDPLPLSPPLPMRIKLAYSVGHVLNDLVASCWFSYLLVFLRTVLLFQSTAAGALMLIGQLADGLATPIVGILSDRTESKFGKRRLWILSGSILVAITFPPIFHLELISISSDTGRLIYYSILIILFQFAWASVQVNHLALVPELTKDSNERVYLNSSRSIFTILSNVTVFILAFFLIQSNKSTTAVTATGPGTVSTDSLGPGDINSFFHLSIIVIGIGLLFSIIFIIGTPEPQPRPKKFGSITVEWYHWLSYSKFYQTAIIYTCTRLLVNISQTYMPLFLLTSLSAPKSSIASVPLTVFGSGLLSTIFCEKLTRKLGSEGLTILGCILILFTSTGIYILPKSEWELIYLISILLGIGTGIVGVSALSLICNLVSDSCESSAFVYGSMSLADKIANGIAIMLAEAAAPNVPDSTAVIIDIEYYRYIMVFIPGISAAIAIALLTSIILTQGINKQSVHCGSVLSTAETDEILSITDPAALSSIHHCNSTSNNSRSNPIESTPLLNNYLNS